MEQVSVVTMLWTLALAYMATYGLGAAACALAKIRPTGGIGRIGVFCGVGTVIVGWVGYICAVNSWELLARLVVWIAALTGAALIAWHRRQDRDEDEPIPGRALLVLMLAIVIAIGYRAGISYGQVRLTDEGLSARGLWPDLLYRNAIVKEFMTFDGPPQWPWLAGKPLKGTSVLRFSATATLLSAAGVRPDQYQHAASWLGLYGIPVAAGAIFALLRFAGAAPMVAALAVLITAFFGNPRWLMAERFAHSPTLVWAGGDVFAFVFPAFYATVAVAFAVAGRFIWPAAILGIFMLGSVTAFGPWFALALTFGILLWLLYCLVSRSSCKAALALSIGAVLGLVTLKTLCGTGAGGGSLLAILGPSPVIRSMQWAFPFLAEPLGPLIADMSPLAIAKLLKFAIAYGCAAMFFMLGSLWVRALFIADWRRWEWRKLGTPAYALGGGIVVAGFLLTTCCDFSKVAYDYAGYDMLRLLWLPLLFANLALAQYAYEHRANLRRWWAIAVAVIVIGLGGWEYSYYVLEKRMIEPPYHVRAAELEVISYINQHADADDTVLINPLVAAETKPEKVGHDWGYFSGLCIPALWLDNRDMAYKFAQHQEWDRRALRLRSVMAHSDPMTVLWFLGSEDIGWIYLQGDDDFEVGLGEPDLGLETAFSNEAGRLYRVGATVDQTEWRYIDPLNGLQAVGRH